MRLPSSERPHPAGMGGIQRHYFFPNGWGASVIKTPFSYGGDKGLWELGVLHGPEGAEHLCYKSGLTDDVFGYCSEAEIDERLGQIEALPHADSPLCRDEHVRRREESLTALRKFAQELGA